MKNLKSVIENLKHCYKYKKRALHFLKFSCIVYSCIDLKQFTIYISCIDNFYLKYRYLSCVVN